MNVLSERMLWGHRGFWEGCRLFECEFSDSRRWQSAVCGALANLITVSWCVRSLINSIWLSALSCVTWHTHKDTHKRAHKKNISTIAPGFAVFFCPSDEEIIPLKKKGKNFVCVLVVCVGVCFSATCALSLMTTDLTRIGGPLWRTANSLRCNILLWSWIQNKEFTILHYL